MKFFSIAFLLFLSYYVARALDQNQRNLQTNFLSTGLRGMIVRNYCTDQINRQSLFAQYGLDDKIPYSSAIQGQFSFNTGLIDQAIVGQWGYFLDQLKNSSGQIFLFVGAWIIGGGIAILIWPFLIACCLCPWTCPFWSKKPTDKPYTRFQLLWPAIACIVLLLLVLVVGIIGISSPFKALHNYSQVACSSGFFLDDTNNGNRAITDPNKFFSGIRTIDTVFRDIKTKKEVLMNQYYKLSNSSTDVRDIEAKIQTAKAATAQVPSLNRTSFLLNYSLPLQSSPGTQNSTTPSTLSKILGTFLENKTLVGAAYSLLADYKVLVQQNSAAAENIALNSKAFVGKLDQVIQTTSLYASELENLDKKINDFWTSNKMIFQGIQIGTYVFYGVCILLSLLMIVAVSLAAFLMNSCCRRFMYALCVMFFFLCIIAFLFCILISTANPVLYFSCQYVNENFQSKVRMKSTLTKLNMDAYIAGNISECVAADGSGDLTKNILDSSVYSVIDDLNTSYINLLSIGSGRFAGISSVHSTLQTSVSSYKKAQVLDIQDYFALSKLRTLSQPTSYSCTSPGFLGDSWIPSNNQNRASPLYISCKIDQGANSSSATCANLQAFKSKAKGCAGCMDTFDFFKAYQTQADVKRDLDSRYPEISCQTFKRQLSNVWGNFYRVKAQVIGQVQGRAVAAKSNADSVAATLKTFGQVQKTLEATVPAVFTSKGGLMQGFNCQTIGEDMKLLKNVMCKGLFSFSYFTRVIFGILSLALLFLMCFTTFAGHRNFKQIQIAGEHQKKMSELNYLQNLNTERQLAQMNPNPTPSQTSHF